MILGIGRADMVNTPLLNRHISGNKRAVMKSFKNCLCSKLPVLRNRRSEGGVSREATQALTPDGGYGWVVVGSCFTLNAFTWGVTSVCYSVINESSAKVVSY